MEEPRGFKAPLSYTDTGILCRSGGDQLFALSLFGAEGGAAALSEDDDLVSEPLLWDDEDSDELADESLFEPLLFEA
jgi:hypothetical protein